MYCRSPNPLLALYIKKMRFKVAQNKPGRKLEQVGRQLLQVVWCLPVVARAETSRLKYVFIEARLRKSERKTEALSGYQAV